MPVLFAVNCLSSEHWIGGYLEGSTNDGTTFYYMSGVTTGWVFGTYDVPKGADLFKLIERIAAAPPGASNSVKARAPGVAQIQH